MSGEISVGEMKYPFCVPQALVNCNSWNHTDVINNNRVVRDHSVEEKESQSSCHHESRRPSEKESQSSCHHESRRPSESKQETYQIMSSRRENNYEKQVYLQEKKEKQEDLVDQNSIQNIIQDDSEEKWRRIRQLLYRQLTPVTHPAIYPVSHVTSSFAG
jgi:hypothetical protein